jgi:glycosyltransferase involved in cell wall biosynthesis
MRIAYFAHVNGGPGTGVYQKIVGQLGRWRAEGHDVRLFLFTRDEAFLASGMPGDPIVGCHQGPASRLRVTAELVGRIRRFDPDVVYWRQSLFYPAALRLPRRAALIIEIQTDDLREFALGSRARSGYHRLTRGVLLRRAQALVFVTPELANGSTYQGYPASRHVITNGIDLDAYPELPAPRNDSPHLAFVGSAGMRWHGVDKLVALAEARPGWHFDIVGYDAPSEASGSNMTYHGISSRAEVLAVLAGADVAVASLALHRIGMQQGSTLKMREYLAVGTPVIYAASDPDVDGIVPHTLRIANTETGVIDGLDAIDEFVHRVNGHRIPREAVAHVHTERKERERLAMFQEVLRSTAKGSDQ